MEQFTVTVKTSNEPGAGFYTATINADTSYNAIQQARAMYGSLLISESARPVTGHKPPQ